MVLAWNLPGRAVERHKTHRSGQDSHLQAKNSTRYLAESFRREKTLTANEYVLHTYGTLPHLKGLLISLYCVFHETISFLLS
jgi:hypothetical protein